MPDANDIRWFKTQFEAQINAVVAGTPFDVDRVTAIACQETGYIWSRLRKTDLPIARILELCVGDTLDAPNRSAFPKTKADLVAYSGGQQMFDIARAALVDMAAYIPGYSGAANNPNKFCHGYGVFQYDLQFFKVDPAYFLNRRYIHFADSLGKCVQELQAARSRIGYAGKTSLTDAEMAAVAIAYNTGGYKPAKGLKQGHFDGTKYYGERYADFLALARSVVVPAGAGPIVAEPVEPAPVTAALFKVDTNGGLLRLRSSARVSPGNVVARLANGQVVREIGEGLTDGFRKVEATVAGDTVQGFAKDDFLKPLASAGTAAAPLTPAD